MLRKCHGRAWHVIVRKHRFGAETDDKLCSLRDLLDGVMSSHSRNYIVRMSKIITQEGILVEYQVAHLVFGAKAFIDSCV